MSKIINRCVSLSFNIVGMVVILLLVLSLDTNLGYNAGILGFAITSILIWWNLFEIEQLEKKVKIK